MSRWQLLLWVALFGALSARSTSLAQTLLPRPMLTLQEPWALRTTATTPALKTIVPGTTNRQARARNIMAAGAGFLLSALVQVPLAIPRGGSCRGHDPSYTRSLKAATVVGAVGLTMTVGGATWLSLEARRSGMRTSWQKRLGAVGIGALTMIAGSLPLTAVWISDQLLCAD